MGFKTGCRLYYTYIVQCADHTLYTGYTTSLWRRLEMHNSGKGAKYTRCRKPVALVYFEPFLSRSAACAREYQIKKKTRKEKEALIRSMPACCLIGPPFPVQSDSMIFHDPAQSEKAFSE